MTENPYTRRYIGWYVLDADHNPVECPDMVQAAEWFFGDDNRRVAWTDVAPGVAVSTIFLGLDHGFGGEPQLFESTVINDYGFDFFHRYPTWAEAEAGHNRIVAILATANLRIMELPAHLRSEIGGHGDDVQPDADNPDSDATD